MKTVLLKTIQFGISTMFSSIRYIRPCQKLLLGARVNLVGKRGTPNSPKLQHYLKHTIRLFIVISRTLPGGVLSLCRNAVRVSYSSIRLGWDCLGAYLGHSLGESYPSAEMESLYPRIELYNNLYHINVSKKQNLKKRQKLCKHKCSINAILLPLSLNELQIVFLAVEIDQFINKFQNIERNTRENQE